MGAASASRAVRAASNALCCPTVRRSASPPTSAFSAAKPLPANDPEYCREPDSPSARRIGPHSTTCNNRRSRPGPEGAFEAVKLRVDDITADAKELAFSEPEGEINRALGLGPIREYHLEGPVNVVLSYYRAGTELFF